MSEWKPNLIDADGTVFRWVMETETGKIYTDVPPKEEPKEEKKPASKRKAKSEAPKDGE